jgi:hypothetical protein
MKSSALTVNDYLAELPEDRRAVIDAVRAVVLKNLPKGYRESMNCGMISYEVPLERFPTTYNGQPLMYAALAAQKSFFALYLMCVYGDADRARWLAGEFKKAGKKLDMGKSCLRFKKLEDLPLPAIGKLVASVPVAKFIAAYEIVKPPAKGKRN